MKLEICAGSVESAIHAQNAGAHRIELCRNLELEGLTPEESMLKQVLADVEIPVFVLIRPRAGDFVYSDEEFDSKLHAIDMAKAAGARGIVSGILHPDNTLDVERTNKLVKRSEPLPFTFHRAFDLIPDKFNALDELSSMGVNRVLTSAGFPTAYQGFAELAAFQNKAGKELIILPGGGLVPDQVAFFKLAGFPEIHTSARRLKTDSPLSLHSDSSIISDFISALNA